MKKEKIKIFLKNLLASSISLIVSAVVLMMAGMIFKGFYIESFWIAIVTAAVITLLNYLLKPALVYLTLPITVLSLGLFYPIINVIILKITSLIMGSSFQIEGIIAPIFIAIFISFMNILLQNLIVKPIMRR
ncbi:MAG TPA: phage holin family protein [Bacilli bacterium]|nr:phage holin family protein [Bacilli bacterium]